MAAEAHGFMVVVRRHKRQWQQFGLGRLDFFLVFLAARIGGRHNMVAAAGFALRLDCLLFVVCFS